MMETTLRDPDTIEEMIRLYYKKGMDASWDEFDNILLHLAMLGMHQGGIEKIKGFDQVQAQFRKRAERREFPALRFLVYVNASVMIANDLNLMHDLLRYGLDYIYPKLTWTDKVQILDMANRSQAPYV
jgi:hypothetical protein